MRICYIGPPSINMKVWLTSFAKRGHEVILITEKPISPLKVKNVRMLPLGETRILTRTVKFHEDLHKMGGFRFIASDLFSILKIPRQVAYIKGIFKDINPDVVHACNIYPFGIYAASSGFPSVVSVWGTDIFIRPSRAPLYLLYLKYIFKNINIVHVQGNADKRRIFKLGCPETKIISYPRAIDTSKFSPCLKMFAHKNKLRMKLGLKNNEKVVITMRSLCPVYDTKTQLYALKYVIETIPNIKFIIGGDGPERENLQKLARQLQITNHVIFLGRVPHKDVPIYYAISDLFIQTPISDGLSPSMKEAMACGLPVISTAVGVNSEYIIDDYNGFLIPPRNPRILAEKIVKILQNDKMRERMGEKNVRIALEKFSLEKFTEKFEKIYESLCSHSDMIVNHKGKR